MGDEGLSDLRAAMISKARASVATGLLGRPSACGPAVRALTSPAAPAADALPARTKMASESRPSTPSQLVSSWPASLKASVALGVRPTDWVLVHDAARCLITPALVDSLIDACLPDACGGLLALPLPDTLKSESGRRVQATVPREDKWLAQTPQMFRLGDLLTALAATAASGFAGVTDEASAMEIAGHHPLLVAGSAHNFKVTYPQDFALAQAVLAIRAQALG